jgi:hypothetical protein
LRSKKTSKANPRNLVFTIGFSAGVGGLAMAKGPKPREADAESFLIDTGIGEASNWRVAQRSSTEGIDSLAPGDAAKPAPTP